ncbi:MAG: OmpA family protein [Deltaproteobacteria bacterium]|nr:OmpA family protein [Deltaproteobacteria bacterium]
MKRTWIPLIVFALFLMAGCAPTYHFGVEDKSCVVPDEFGQTEAAIASAEKSSAAKYCPDKIARAKALGKKGVETYWACRTDEALAILDAARRLAKDAESCQPPKPKVAPPPPAVTPRPAPPAKREVTLKWVHFDFDKADLTPQAKATLDETAKILKDHPGMMLELDGYTDVIGTDAYNLKLSERRAKTVHNYLVSKGVPAARLKVKALGKSNPVADNKTPQGRAENRRVELRILR